MKKFLLGLSVFFTVIVAFATIKGSPFLPEVDQRFHDLENQLAGTLTGVNLVLTGDLTGDGGDQLVGFLQAQVASTTVAITASQCGSTFVSNSADVMTLPEASTVLGCRLTFVCGTADDFDVNPADGTDVIGITGSITGSNTTTVLAPSAGDAIRCTDIGAGFQLEAVGADLWAVLGTNGIITDVN